MKPPEDNDPHSLAEFIEGELMLSGDEYLSFSELRGLHAAGRQFGEEDMTFALAEIEDRDRTEGKHYPFFVVDRGVGYDAGEHGVLYRFLLLLSLRNTPTRETGKYARTDPLFDAVIREAFKAVYGPEAKAIVFAWPPRDGRPTTFAEAVTWAADTIGVKLRGGIIPGHKLDAGVDVIVWRPFSDARNAFQIILVQNTVQMKFAKKPRDVDAQEWRDWLLVGTAPTVGFAVPFSMPEGDIWWADVGKGASVVLDRGRIISELSAVDPRAWAEWEPLRNFVANEIQAIHDRGGVEDEPSISIIRRRKAAKGS